MRSDETKRILRALHDRPVREARGRGDLETELLARHASITRPERGGLMRNLMRRPVVVALLIAVTGIAACTVPTETDVELGHRLIYTFTPESAGYEDAVATLDALQEVVRTVEAFPGVENVGVSIEESDGGPVTIDMLVWGVDFDAAALQKTLHRRWPALTDARVEAEPLVSAVKTSFGEKLGHDLFRIDVLDGTEEEMRARILEQIYAGGFEGEAVVDVRKYGDLTTIGVEMTHDGDGVQTEDEFVIEIKGE